MDPYDLQFCTLLKELVLEGKVSQSRIDDAVRRILLLKYRLGLFDQPNTGKGKAYADFGSEKSAKVALQAAEESIILLKNESNLLPLSPAAQGQATGLRLLVTGPNANQMRCLNGGWSYTWQGNLTDRYAQQYNTIYEALSNRFGSSNVVLEQGVTYVPEGAYQEEEASRIDEAVRAAQNVDVIIACVGENSYTETVGNLSDLALSENQRRLVKALAQTGKPIILVLNEGRPRLVNDLEPLCQAVIDILLPGNYGADALARLLAGDANFSGRLPYTYPRNPADLTTYDYRVSEHCERMAGAYDYDATVNVQWPFGYGLSYTTFAYSNMRIDKPRFSKDDVLTVSIDVTNTGNREGKESVLLYSTDLVASLTPENCRLRAFEKVSLQPQETRTVTFRLPAKDLAFVGADGQWVLEEGDFRLTIGSEQQTVTCE
jgi:beta-glucosidase